MLEIKLEAYEGPLDLLYKLIEKNEIDIYDIPIVKLTEQYIEYINNFSKSIESISEFLWFAASLIEIKSRMLLPKEVFKKEAEEDPREELIKKLEEYKMFKDIAEAFKERVVTSEQILYKLPEIQTINNLVSNKEVKLDDVLENITLNQLFCVFNDIMKRQEIKKERVIFRSISKDTFTVQDRILYIKDLLKSKKSFNFKDIFDYTSLKVEKIVTFMAVLELIKVKAIKITQNSLFGEITITAFRDGDI